ncbi:SH3 domain-containing protein [Actimicrobium antarcticum]|uniref:SH3b domain-containing protein n=1 Tax=Actimicrobium antarcticum TaxID=1051899 RepID=A0ABP7T7R2_9BURK
MKFDRLHCVVAVLSLSAIGSAQALDYKSIGAAPAVLYDAPSARGKKVFVAPRNMPVEVILTYGEWTKVRDAGGDLSWVESKSLTPKRHVLVKTAGARVRSAADEAAGTVFTAEKGVLLELAEPAAAGWVKVRHRDGQAGFIKVGEVWGE